MTFCAQKEAFHAQIVRLKAIRVICFSEVIDMKLATILKDFFLRYGEQGACCASWRGSYEPPVPEALKNAVLEEEKKKTHGNK